MTRPDNTPRHPGGRTCGGVAATYSAGVALLLAVLTTWRKR